MNKSFLPLSRFENIVMNDVVDETLVYDFESDRALCLNETCSLVWKACDGKKTIPEITAELSKKLNSKVSEDLVYYALGELKSNNLLKNGEQIAPNFNGLSRRDVIKKVALGTVVAIPLISSLIAPVAAEAASGCLTTGNLCGPSAPAGTAPCCNSCVFTVMGYQFVCT